MSALAEVLGVHRSSFYQKLKRSCPFPTVSPQKALVTDVDIVRAIRELWNEHPSYTQYGYRRLRALLARRKGWIVNHKRLRRILAISGLGQARIERRRPKPTADRPTNEPTRPNQVWQMDMTKFFLEGFGWVHVMGIIDLFDRMIVGYHISPRARGAEWLATFNDAVQKRFPDGVREALPLILQTDNGCQPTSRAFVKGIRLCDVGLAYTALATPEHNACIERFFRTLKEEEIWPNLYETYEQAVQSIERYIAFYNLERVHSSLGYRTPADYHAAMLATTLAA